MARTTRKRSDKLIARWLVFMAFLVIAMIVVGGATRLTDSGLSIAHWSPIHGAIPPLNANDWQQEFALYQTIPEFKLQNHSMTLEEFKFIFWWEWAHRLLGRFFGLCYLIPLIIFAIRGHIHNYDAPVLVGTLFLIGLQGFLGWWMVSSGLKGSRLDVEAIRLATHLGMAFLLLGILISAAHSRRTSEIIQFTNNPWTFILFVVFLQIIMGALVAGTDAGLSHNDWPLIDGAILPKNYLMLEPIWRNFIENTQNIQFNHRIFGYLILFLVVNRIFKFGRMQKNNHKKWVYIAVFLIILQVLLGILTLNIFGKFPPPHKIGVLMGLCHQLSGAIFFCSIVLCWKTYPNYRS